MKPEIIYLPLSEIKPYENNPRYNESAVDAVAQSIKEFGFKNPIIVDKHKVIIAGHTRYKASQQLGLEEVPCIIASDLTDKQAKAFRLADNKLSELAEWDFIKLESEILGLPEYDMEEFGFNLQEIEDKLDLEKELVDDEYEIPEKIETRVHTGELWQLGNHRLMCGDSTKAQDVEKLMNGNKADMVFTDPPYGVSYEGGSKIENGKIKSNKKEKIKNDNLVDYDNLYLFLYDVFNNLKVSTKEKSAIYIFYTHSRSREFLNAFYDNKLKQRSIIVWHKQGGGFGDFMAHYMNAYEPCIYGSNGETVNWFGASNEKTVWEIKKGSKSGLHPTMKPLELCGRAIFNSSQEGWVVLDLFGGSGSTLIASEQLNRSCYMMELDEKYVDVIIDRWEKYTGRKAVKVE